MSQAAALILAHNNPRQVRRLALALRGLELFLHVDARTPESVFTEMVNGSGGVDRVARHPFARRSWIAVEGELAALREVVERSKAEHIIVLSGACYPLVSVAELLDELAMWRGLSRIELNPIPYWGWSHSRFIRDGGLHRFDRRYAAVGGQLLLIRGMPIPVGRRRVPPELRLQASSQWKIYAREHVLTLLRVFDERPELVRFWRTTFVPQESCLASVLASPALVGKVADEIRHDRAWYIDWRGSEDQGHPRWLTLEDFDQISRARAEPPLRPDDPPSRGEDARKLFARKMGAPSETLLDRIDAELRT